MQINASLIQVQQPSSRSSTTDTRQPITIEGALESLGLGTDDENTDKEDKVTLSREGKELQASDAHGTEKSAGGSIMDQVIAKLKERIEETNEQLKRLSGKEGPGVEDQRKMLQEQLSILQGSLLRAIQEKARIEGEAQ